jgi:hypothetical protein
MVNRWPGQLLCVNTIGAPGKIKEVVPCSTCRNFRARQEPTLRLPEPEPPNGAVRYIGLTKGMFAIVDAEDYEWLSRYSWVTALSGGKLYAARHEKGKRIFMHREIMHAPKSQVVDHIDGNSLNNPKVNLRLCSCSENNCNRRPTGKTSGYKGVSRYKRSNLWRSTASYKGKSVHVGYYEDEIEAARASDHKNVELHGEFAYVNFPEEWPKERIKAVYKAAEPERLRLEALIAQRADKKRRKVSR